VQDDDVTVDSNLYLFTSNTIDDWKIVKINDMVSYAGVEQLKDVKPGSG